MKLASGEFVTEEVGGEFAIRITQESDLSQDGGYTFEDVENCYFLGKAEAKALIQELTEYLNKLED